MKKHTWKEKYTGILLIIIGIIYLALELQSVFTGQSRSSSMEEDSIILNRSEVYSDIRAIITILCSIGGGWLILKVRKAGWVMGSAVLIVFSIIQVGLLIQILMIKVYDAIFISLSVSALLLLFALVLLWLPATIKRFGILPRHIIMALLSTAILAMVFFWLQ